MSKQKEVGYSMPGCIEKGGRPLDAGEAAASGSAGQNERPAASKVLGSSIEQGQGSETSVAIFDEGCGPGQKSKTSVIVLAGLEPGNQIGSV